MTGPPPAAAMVLAAGLGLRLRPLTENCPKPLIELAGRTLLDRALDHLAAAGVPRVVINLHYLGHMIETHLSGRSAPVIDFSREDEALLETGGGVTKALASLGSAAFYVVNADITWTDGKLPALHRLAAAWRDDDMDALLLLHPVTAATGYDGVGDYTWERISDGEPEGQAGHLTRRRERPSAPYVFTGVQLLHPRLFTDAPSGPFSLTRLYDRAEAAGRLYGIVHDGDWHHIGTPAGLAEAAEILSKDPARVGAAR
ncbi:MAG: nucleotidyltransferase family protein [Proteobacteria bacterium]|nr:nucleotidyltransferase family protein [Pseudomonadota bacterium]